MGSSWDSFRIFRILEKSLRDSYRIFMGFTRIFKRWFLKCSLQIFFQDSLGILSGWLRDWQGFFQDSFKLLEGSLQVVAASQVTLNGFFKSSRTIRSKRSLHHHKKKGGSKLQPLHQHLLPPPPPGPPPGPPSAPMNETAQRRGTSSFFLSTVKITIWAGWQGAGEELHDVTDSPYIAKC